MSIRAARIDDLPDVLALAIEMHHESRSSVLSFDDEKTIEMLAWCVDSPDGLLLVAEDDHGEIIGAFAAYCAEQWFSTDKVSSDFGLFVKPSRRGGRAAIKMLGLYSEWAASRGCKMIQLGVTTGVMMDRTARIFELTGFEKVGTLHEFKGAV